MVDTNNIYLLLPNVFILFEILLYLLQLHWILFIDIHFM